MKKVILCILDGFGIKKEVYGNAVKQAYKPTFDQLWNKYPHSLLDASGEAVGLPKGQMGNSEVGHLNIGAGRIVDQPLHLINKKIKDGSFYKTEELINVMDHVKKNESKLHILGLLSDGGVHSTISHIISLLKMAKLNNIKNLYFHIYLDGRDTLENSAYKYVRILEKEIKKMKLGTIATISGRFYAMDRDRRWDRVELAYNAMINGIGDHNTKPKDIISSSYKNGIYDEFVIPTIVNDSGMISDNDGVIFANFRQDRATEMMTAISNPDFKDFKTKRLHNLKVVTMMPCATSIIATSAFHEPKIISGLGDYLANMDKTQLRIAETEKYAHVTFFFDGGDDKVLKRAHRELIPSDRTVLTYDMKPEMSAKLITDKLLSEMTNSYDVIILNYANCDMVGHTGNMKAAVKAVEIVDECLGKLYKEAQKQGYTLMVTADHGNADYMLDKGIVITSHSTSKVPFIICDNKYKVKNGKLGDIAPTILKVMDLKIPNEMTGDVLIE